MKPKTAQDVAGFEYDWLACDARGRVGFFSTAGGGYAPTALLENSDAYDEAIDAILLDLEAAEIPDETLERAETHDLVGATLASRTGRRRSESPESIVLRIG